MPEIKLKIDDLVLDSDNPRWMSHAEGLQDALQKVINEQKGKLTKLAQSISEHGLNPMDRLLVLRIAGEPASYIALEGNRRVAALKLLTNPGAMTGLNMPDAMRKTLGRLASEFLRGKVEPISCFELSSRQEGDYWLELRHQGAQEGAGIVDWEPGAKQRFRTRSPAIQALDLVTERGGLTDEERAQVAAKFPLSTLQRFVEDREVRKALGIDVKAGKVVTELPASEVLKPLKRIVLDLASKKIRVGKLMKTEQMVGYIRGFAKDEIPDLSKTTGSERTLDEIPASEFTKRPRPPRRRPDPSDRKEVVPKNCHLYVSDNRIAEVYRELRTLKLDEARNAIAVLLRVFLELSLDHFLEGNGGTLSFKTSNGQARFKKLDKKLAEVVAMLVKIGIPEDRFVDVTRSLSVPTSPMHIELFHRYIHSRFATPSPPELTAAWNHAQPLFEAIWPVQ